MNLDAKLEDLSRTTLCMELDVRASMQRVYLRDGRCAEVPIRGRLSVDTSSIRRVLYFFDTNKLVMEFVHGDPATVDIYDVRQVDEPITKPVVYLDQCHWSTIAKAEFEPSRVASQEVRDAASELAALALQGEIICPLSMGHLIETTATYDVKRMDLASTMIRLSRGWQMRHPLAIREEEVLEILAGRYGDHRPKRSAVFTLAPNAMLSKERLSGVTERPPGSEVELLWECLTSICGTFDMLMDPERIDAEEATRWAERYSTFSRQLKDLGLSRVRRRSAALGAAIVDVADEVDRVVRGNHIDNAQLTFWVENHLEQDLAGMPFLGLYADVLDIRLSNFNTKWLPNDFIDMFFLTCAMGYADVVAAEKAATNYIKQAWRERPGEAAIVRTLPELVLHLKNRMGSSPGSGG